MEREIFLKFWSGKGEEGLDFGVFSPKGFLCPSYGLCLRNGFGEMRVGFVDDALFLFLRFFYGVTGGASLSDG